MAKQFFKNLPDTTTPLEASRLNGLLDGEEAMGNLVVDSIRSKNMWIPIFGNSVHTGNCNVVIDGDKYKVTTSASATGELYIGQVCASGNSYDTTMGILYAVEPNTTYSFSVSNSAFDQNYLTQYNSSKVSLGYAFKGRNFTFTTPSNCYYITIRIGVANITASTTYETTVQLEKGDTITTYAPYQNLIGKQNIINYASRITILANISFNSNKQIINKNDDGLVVINLTFKANANIDMTNNTDLFTLPSELNPGANTILSIFNTDKNVANVAYIQTASNRVRGKLNTTLNANTELSIVGSYYI